MGLVESKKTIFLVAGESACGKDSLVSKLCQDTDLTQLISYTTRPRRQDEGETHIFISDDEVEQYQDSIIAYTEIGNYKYFCTIEQLYESNIYVIDPKGIRYLKNKVNNPNIRFVTIYINVPINIRKDRAINIRGDKPKVYSDRRFNEFGQFLNFKSGAEFDYAVSNINFDKAYKIFKNIIETEMEDDTND